MTHSLDPEEGEHDGGTDSHRPCQCLPNCYSQEENENTQVLTLQMQPLVQSGHMT